MGGLDWEIVTDTYTLPCIKQITNENSLHSTENSTQFQPVCLRTRSFVTIGARKRKKIPIFSADIGTLKKILLWIGI